MPEASQTKSTHGSLTVRAHTPRLSDDDIARYHDDGYIAVRNAVDLDLVSRMIQAIDRLAAESAKLRTSDDTFDLAPDHTPQVPRLRRISAPTALDPVFFEAAFETTVQDMVADLIGGPVKFYHAKINVKQPGTHSAVVQWHQDWTHFPHTNVNMLAISYPFFPRTRENGAIAFVKRSHKRGPLGIWQDGHYVFTCEHDMLPGDIDGAEYVECVPGDVLFHHGLAVHGSAANMSGDPVATLTIQYAAADAFAYTAPVIDSPHRNWMVRGEPSTHARVEAMTVELPPDFSAGYTSLFSNQDEAAAQI